ncbi:MAG: TolC family protein, partial [Chlamydiota bacterium]
MMTLCACTHVSKDEMAQVLPPVELDDSTSKALAHDFFAEGGWPTENWWEMFGDPQLNAIVELALSDNPTLKKAMEKIQMAEQEAKKERSLLFPKLGFDYDENWDYFSKNGFIRSFFPSAPGFPIPATANIIDLSLNFNYEFDFFGRNRHLFAAAIGKARAQRAEAEMARLVIATLVAQTYIELQTKLAQQRVLKEHVESRASLYRLTDLRSQKGLDPQTPVLMREQNIYEIEQSLILTEKEVALDRHLLGVLVGSSPDKPLAVEPMTALFDRPF